MFEVDDTVAEVLRTFRYEALPLTRNQTLTAIEQLRKELNRMSNDILRHSKARDTQRGTDEPT